MLTHGSWNTDNDGNDCDMEGGNGGINGGGDGGNGGGTMTSITINKESLERCNLLWKLLYEYRWLKKGKKVKRSSSKRRRLVEQHHQNQNQNQITRRRRVMGDNSDHSRFDSEDDENDDNGDLLSIDYSENGSDVDELGDKDDLDGEHGDEMDASYVKNHDHHFHEKTKNDDDNNSDNRVTNRNTNHHNNWKRKFEQELLKLTFPCAICQEMCSFAHRLFTDRPKFVKPCRCKVGFAHVQCWNHTRRYKNQQFLLLKSRNNSLPFQQCENCLSMYKLRPDTQYDGKYFSEKEKIARKRMNFFMLFSSVSSLIILVVLKRFFGSGGGADNSGGGGGGDGTGSSGGGNGSDISSSSSSGLSHFGFYFLVLLIALLWIFVMIAIIEVNTRFYNDEMVKQYSLLDYVTTADSITDGYGRVQYCNGRNHRTSGGCSGGSDHHGPSCNACGSLSHSGSSSILGTIGTIVQWNLNEPLRHGGDHTRYGSRSRSGGGQQSLLSFERLFMLGIESLVHYFYPQQQHQHRHQQHYAFIPTSNNETKDS